MSQIFSENSIKYFFWSEIIYDKLTGFELERKLASMYHFTGKHLTILKYFWLLYIEKRSFLPDHSFDWKRLDNSYFFLVEKRSSPYFLQVKLNYYESIPLVSTVMWIRFWPKPGSRALYLNEGRFLKFYKLNILDIFKSLLFCFHTLGGRRPL